MDKQVREQRLRRRLEEYAKQNVPDNLAIWPVISRRLQQQSSGRVLGQPVTSERFISREDPHRPGSVDRSALPGSARRERQPAINLGLAGLVALIMALGVAAFTLWLLPQADVRPGNVVGNADSAYPQSTFPIRQPVHGYTVSIYPWYAADNHIVITYTVTDPQGSNLPIYRLYQDAMHVYYQGDPSGSKGAPRLSDDLGRDAPWMDSRFAWSNPSKPEEQAPVSDIEAHRDKAACCLHRADVMWLDFVPPTNGEPPDLRNLRLELPVFLPAAVLTSEAKSRTVPSPVPTLTKLGNNVVDARLTFDFPLPADPARRVIQLKRTAEAAGAIVTLEKVVVTPRDTFAALHYGDAPDGKPWLPKSMELTAGGWTSGIVTRQDGIFFVPPADQQGVWVLTITELYRVDTTAQPFKEIILQGPWVFQFTVPPAPSTTP